MNTDTQNEINKVAELISAKVLEIEILASHINKLYYENSLNHGYSKQTSLIEIQIKTYN